jgi:hypothetical protein
VAGMWRSFEFPQWMWSEASSGCCNTWICKTRYKQLSLGFKLQWWALPCLNCCTKGKFETLSGIWTPELNLRNESRKTRIWLLYVYTIVSGVAETPKWIWLWQALFILEAL